MSDALTDIARDQRRSRCFAQYLEAIRVFLKDPTAENKTTAVETATATDEVPRGYWGGKTNVAASVDDLLAKLKDGDKGIWAKFLFSLKESHDFKVLKALSPFANQLIVGVDYGCGFVTLCGDIQPFLDSIISGQNMLTYDADNYVVVLPKPDDARAEVFWIGCGASGPGIPADHPRPANAERFSMSSLMGDYD